MRSGSSPITGTSPPTIGRPLWSRTATAGWTTSSPGTTGTTGTTTGITTGTTTTGATTGTPTVAAGATTTSPGTTGTTRPPSTTTPTATATTTMRWCTSRSTTGAISSSPGSSTGTISSRPLLQRRAPSKPYSSRIQKEKRARKLMGPLLLASPRVLLLYEGAVLCMRLER